MQDSPIYKTITSKKGNTVVFRAPKKEDFDSVWGFACDLSAEDTYVEISGLPAPTKEYEQTYFDKVLTDCKNGAFIYVVVEVNGVYAGSGEVRIGTHRRAHVGNIGLALAPSFRQEGIGTELLRVLVERASVQGLKLLTIHCYETNEPALHVYKKLGFVVSGITPKAVKFGSSFVGEVTLYLPLS